MSFFPAALSFFNDFFTNIKPNNFKININSLNNISKILFKLFIFSIIFFIIAVKADANNIEVIIEDELKPINTGSYFTSNYILDGNFISNNRIQNHISETIKFWKGVPKDCSNSFTIKIINDNIDSQKEEQFYLDDILLTYTRNGCKLLYNPDHLDFKDDYILCQETIIAFGLNANLDQQIIDNNLDYYTPCDKYLEEIEIIFDNKLDKKPKKKKKNKSTNNKKNKKKSKRQNSFKKIDKQSSNIKKLLNKQV